MSTTSATEKSNGSAEPHAHHSAFGRSYWMLNSIEMFERLAYFGIRAVVPLYIMQATEPGGLHLSALHKGWIYMWWAVFQSFLPMVTGGIADRYGYKRVLFFAISANVIGYIMMANLHSYYGFFASILVLATGTAFFKPSLQGSIAQNLSKENSSLGWGVFYWVVNVGAFAAPFISTIVLGKPHSLEGWQTLFYFCAAFTACNLLLLLTFKDVPSGADKTETMIAVLARTIENVWPYWFRGGTLHPSRVSFGILLGVAGIVLLALGEGRTFLPIGLLLLVVGTILVTWLRGGTFTWQLRLPAWLLIMACFWLMMYQLWDLHPNFITDWVNSSMIAKHAPVEAWWEYGDRGLIQVPQQILLNLNAGLIIVLIVPLSWMARKMRTLSAMLVGMSIATCGVLVAGLTDNGWILLLGIVFFSLGEMWTGPKKNEYLGLIAPPGKKGLYLGYVNIPIGIGVGIGSYLGGWVYNNYGEKATLALKEMGARTELVAKAAQAADWSDSLEKIPGLAVIERNEAFERVREDLDENAVVTADTLRDLFRHDQGQIVNLGYLYLAVLPENRDKVKAGLVAELKKLADKLDADGTELTQATPDEAGVTTTPPTTQPTFQPSDLPEAMFGNAQALREMAASIESGEIPFDEFGLGYYVHLLPEWIGKKRVEVPAVVREAVNKDRQQGEHLGDAEIVAMLWKYYGDDSMVLNNLALEYLAQGTSLLHDAVAEMTFDDPVKEIPERIGVDRTKAFAALSAAIGADEDTVMDTLGRIDVPSGEVTDQLFAYLANRPHLRLIAVAKKQWADDVGFLQELIESDTDARQIVESHIDKQSWTEDLANWFSRLFGEGDEEPSMYERLADKPDLIRKALDAKDWNRTPQQAAQLYQLNPFEARALAAGEMNDAALSATHMLWDEYDPQYKVWIPFAVIGVIATIALGIFGQMAKRWKDMNA